MGKRILQLYANDDDVLLAKAKGLNLSEFFRQILKVELYRESKDSDSDSDIDLKIQIAKLSSELNNKLKEIETLKKEVENAKNRRGAVSTIRRIL